MKDNPAHNLLTIYNLLLKKFGQQHWWPGDSKEEIIIGAILTQNTNWRNVEKSIDRLKTNNLINFNNIIKVDDQKLANIIRSSGYYNQKAKRLKTIADFFIKNHLLTPQHITTKRFREMLLDIKGIGEETADSILLYAFGRPIFVIDAYTKRIFNRLGFLDKKTSYKAAQDFFMENLNPSEESALDKNEKLFNEFHALLVKLGKDICKKIPLCSQCPLKSECTYFNDNL